MFCWKQGVSPALLFSFWSYRTASTKKTLSKQAQRAAWATKIIRTIKYQSPEECIYSPSLKEKLESLEDPHPSYQFDQDIKQEILKTFTSGVSLNYQSFRQERFKRARETKLHDMTIIFCPNYLVTQQMFNLIDKYSLLMAVGGYGISKSICLMLYCNLAKHINLYTYQASISKVKYDKETGIDLKQEMKTLNKQMIVSGELKFWYWTIHLQNIRKNGWKSIQTSFIAQAFELSKEEKNELWKCQSLKEFILKLGSYYPQSKQESTIIIDQINDFASLMRQWNKFVRQTTEYLAKKKKLTQQELLSLEVQIKIYRDRYFHPAKELISFFYDIEFLCDQFILNSAISIERNLFQETIKRQPQKSKFVLQTQEKLGLKPLVLPIFGHHDRVKQVNMAYNQKLREYWGKNDFFHFFWFEFQRMLSFHQFSQEKVATAQRIYLSVAEKRIAKSYYRIIYINDYIQTIFFKPQKFKKAIEALPSISDLLQPQTQMKMSEFFSQNTLTKMFPSAFKAVKEEQRTLQAQDSPQKAYQNHPLVTIFNEIFDQFDHNCKNWQIQRVQMFMKKGDNRNKLRFMATIYSIAEQALFENKELKFPVSYLQKVLGKDVAAHFLSEQHNQQLLPINRNVKINETVAIQWTPAQFIELTNNLICPNIFCIHYKSLFASFRFPYYQIRPLFRGHLSKLLFLKQINPKAILKFKMFIDKYMINEFPIKISESLTFFPFNEQPLQQLYSKDKPSESSNQVRAQTKKMYYLQTNLPVNMQSNQSSGQREIIPYDVDLHFDDILSYCNKNIGRYVSGLPFYKQSLVHNNKCVDFVLAIKKSIETTIYTFDLSVGTNVDDKIKDASNFLKNLAAQSPKKFKFVHMIVAPKETCQESIQISNSLSIRFSDVDSFEMENLADPNEYFLLKILQEANKKLRKQKASQRR